MSVNRIIAATAGLAAAFLLVSPHGAQAQFFGRPAQQEVAPQNDPAALMVRIDRLENQIRSLTGQLEEAQFQNRRLEDQVRRLQDAGMTGGDGAAQRPGSAVPAGPQRRGEPMDLPSTLPLGGPTPRGRGDAFDPSQLPGAPGAPRVLGQVDRSAAISGPLGSDPLVGDDPNAPLDLLNPRRGPVRQSAGAASPPGPGPAQLPQTLPLPQPGVAQANAEAGRQPARTQTAMQADPTPSTLPPAGPREQLDAALLAVRQSDFDTAEKGFKDFLQRFPTSRLAPEAIHNLGDVYARRGRHREAAEQFLKVTTDHAKSSLAPASLHRLGQSLERLGAKEQACAAWAEVPRKYPSASASTRAAAERELKRAQC